MTDLLAEPEASPAVCLWVLGRGAGNGQRNA